MALHLILLIKFLFFFTPVKTDNIPASIYDFKVAGLTGGTIDFAKFKGKKILIVNTASQCGNTPQYADLEAMSKKYQGKLVIVGFPANDFGSQEPGSDKEISEFCQKNYSVTFPMASKITVKGDEMAPHISLAYRKEVQQFKRQRSEMEFPEIPGRRAWEISSFF